MGKSVRINISLPQELQGVYQEISARTGVSLPQVLVSALATQAAYARRWVATWNYQPREIASHLIDIVGGEVVVEGGGVPTPALAVQNETGRLSRQQRRRQELLSRKVQRVASK